MERTTAYKVFEEEGFVIDSSESFASGTYGAIYHCRKTGERESKYVAKKILKKAREDSKTVIDSEKATAEELGKMKPPHVLFAEAFIDEKDAVYIIMKFCNCGDLNDYVMKDNQCVLPFYEVKRLFSEIAEALAAMHGRRMAHRDMKCQNVFLHREKGRVEAYLGDFGYAKSMGTDKFFSTTLGTTATMSPELLKSDTANESVDIWAMGVILYQMCFGDYPFKDNVVRAVENGTYKLPKCFMISAECVDLMEWCLQYKSENRPTAKHLFNHDFIAKPLNEQSIIWIKEEFKMNVRKRGILGDEKVTMESFDVICKSARK